MNKEKIVLGNNTELAYDAINFKDGCLVIGFVGGDAVALEQTFREAGQDNLEHINQVDPYGNVMTTHNYFDIFTAVNKRINAAELVNGEKSDVVEIVLAAETETEARLRHLEARMNSTEEVTDTLLMNELA